MRRGLLLLILVCAGVGWAIQHAPDSSQPWNVHDGDTPSAETQVPQTDVVLTGRAPAEVSEPHPDLVVLLTAKDKIDRLRGLKLLREALRTSVLTMTEVFELFVANDGLHYKARRVLRGHLLSLGVRAAPLLPRILALIEANASTEEPPESATRAASLLSGIADGKPPNGAQAVLRPVLGRAITLLSDSTVNQTLRSELLVFPMTLGGEMVELAPALVAWLQAIEKYQSEYEAENPGICVSWDGTEFRVQEALSKLGPGALPSIVTALERAPRGTSLVRANSSYTLHLAIKEMDASALPSLHELLSHADDRIALSALAAIATLRKGTPELRSLLRDAARDHRPRLRRSAMKHLGALGAAAVPDLLIGLRDAERRVRNAALRALNKNPDALSAVIPELLALLRDGGANVPVDVLAKIGPAAAEAAPYVFDKLIAALGKEVRRQSLGAAMGGFVGEREIKALQAFGSQATRYLVEQATGAKADRRSPALFALQQMETVDPRDVAPLAQHIGDLQGMARIRAATILAHGAGSVAILHEGLRSEDRAMRVASAQGLQKSGVAGLTAWSALVEGLRRHGVLNDAEDANFRVEGFDLLAYHHAVVHLIAFEPPRAIALLQDTSDAVIDAGNSFLAQQGEAGLAMAKAHFSTFSNKGRVRVAGSFAHVAFRRKTPMLAARRWVLSLLAHDEPNVRLAVARVKMGPEHASAQLAALVELLSHKEHTQAVAFQLRAYGAKLAPYEAQLRAAQPKEKDSPRRWIQDILDAIEVSKAN